MSAVVTPPASPTVAGEIRTAVRHSALFGFGNVLAKAVSFLMLPFYTNYLNPREYGILEIIELSLSVLGMVLHMGLAPAMLRSYAAARSEEEKRVVVGTAFLLAAGLGGATFLLGIGLIRPVTRVLFGEGVPALYLGISFITFVLGYIASSTRTYLYARGESGRVVFLDTSALFLTLALNIYFIAVLKIGLVGILLSPLVVNIGWTLLTIRVLLRVGIRFCRSVGKQMAVFGTPLILSNLAMFTLNFSDRFFLQRFESLDAVGVYAVGYKLAFMVNYLVVQPFYIMWQARMYIIYRNPDHPAVFRRMFALYTVLLTWMALALAVLSPEVIAVMAGPKFAAGKDVIPVVALAYVVYGLGCYVQAGMFLTNNTRLVGAISAGAAVLNIALNAALIPMFGMYGAAWATLLSFASVAAVTYRASQRVLPLQLGAVQTLAIILAGVGVYVASSMWTPSSLATAVLVKVLVIMAFPFFLWRLRMFSLADACDLVPGGDRMNVAMLRLARVFSPGK